LPYRLPEQLGACLVAHLGAPEQRVTAEPVLAEGDLDEIVCRVHIALPRADDRADGHHAGLPERQR
jgi:hypothetical protein